MVNEKMISNLHRQLLTVVCRQRVQGLQFRRGEECVIAVQRQWALPFSIDVQDPQLPFVTRHVGGARSVHMQTIQGGAVLCAAVSKVIAVFFKGKKR